MSQRVEPRWLNPDQTADYLAVRVDQLRQLVRAGLVPEPNYMLGKRRPRWDRIQLDAKLEAQTKPSIDAAIEAAFNVEQLPRRKA